MSLGTLALNSVLLAGCNAQGFSINRDSINRALSAQLAASNAVELSSFGSSDWEKLCVIRPYTNNDAAKALLGFDWDAEGLTGIDMHDSFYVLAFVQGNKVTAHTKMARDERELLSLEPACVERSHSLITRSKEGTWTLQE